MKRSTIFTACAVAVITSGFAWVRAQETDSKPDDNQEKIAGGVAVFEYGKVYDESWQVNEFNDQVDQWQKQLNEANETGDQAKAAAVRKAYREARDSVLPRFNKALAEILPKVCRDNGCIVAIRKEAEISWMDDRAKKVDITAELLKAMKAAKPASSTADPNGTGPDGSPEGPADANSAT
jgi:Skp family chaperone for outer membrane proteins